MSKYSSSNTSSSSSFASFPESITKTPPITVHKRVTDMLDRTGPTSDVFYRQSLSKIGSLSKSLDYSSLTDECSSKYSERNVNYKKMIFELLNQLNISRQALEILKRTKSNSNMEVVKFKKIIKKLERQLLSSKVKIGYLRDKINKVNSRIIQQLKKTKKYKKVKSSLKKMKKDNKKLKKKIVTSRIKSKITKAKLKKVNRKLKKAKKSSKKTKKLLKKVKKSLKKRDESDKNRARKEGKLMKTKDSWLINNTHLSITRCFLKVRKIIDRELNN